MPALQTFHLNLFIDPKSLQHFQQAQLKVTLGKPTGSGEPDIDWITFNPFENNSVSWEEAYGIYCARNQSLQEGTSPDRISDIFPAEAGMVTPFEADLRFGTAHPGGTPPRSYAVQNFVPESSYPVLTFGAHTKCGRKWSAHRKGNCKCVNCSGSMAERIHPREPGIYIRTSGLRNRNGYHLLAGQSYTGGFCRGDK